ncbi:MAG: hypothetical protein K8S55_02910 [Phycisphaerae bacterium]|nr:hypothetical protein [Phycisphaerae bacterium]
MERNTGNEIDTIPGSSGLLAVEAMQRLSGLEDLSKRFMTEFLKGDIAELPSRRWLKQARRRRRHS